MNASSISARLPGRGSSTLQTALAELHAVLVDADMTHAIPLLSEATVRAAIPQALAQHRARSSRAHGRQSETDVIRLATVRPALTALVEHGTWPTDARFTFSFTAFDSTGVGHNGLSVGLDLRGSDDQPSHRFTLPLLEVRYGAW